MSNKLFKTVESLIAPGKGILAADESTPTIKKRFDTIGLESTEDTRRAYRSLLFNTQGVEDAISGVILFDETARQSENGQSFNELLTSKGIVPGIKVDGGAKEFPGRTDEKITLGLDGLRERLAEYADLGLGFAKWRAVINITDNLPSRACVDANATQLALYAGLCQEAGIVPIVEPEILMDGTHTLERSEEVTQYVLNTVFAKLADYGVSLEGMLLKPNMVVPGYSCPTQKSVDEVAESTVNILRRTVPSAVPGIVFLSGGQSASLATAHLNAMIANHSPLPWALSYSFGRALQSEALASWQGKDANLADAQAVFANRCKLVSLAAKGEYAETLEQAA